MFKNIRLTVFFAAIMVSMLAISMPIDTIEVVKVERVAKTRVTRTIFELEYKVIIKNNGQALTDVEGIYSSAAAATTISDAQLIIGDIGANETLTPLDTAKFQHDRRSPFNPDDLSWSFTGEITNLNLPPDPGAAGKISIAGIDSDNDGIRDDIQRFIFLNYLNAEITQNALIDVAIILQNSLTSTTKNQAIQTAELLDRATECLIYATSMRVGENQISLETIEDAQDIHNALLSQVVNTEDRLNAYLNHQEFLGGETFSSAAMTQESLKESCTFNVNQG
ncbi:hypothetical protein [Colwellia sp. MB02u-9]|uniref:hypothetical protein n=1 Tax=Colwellia sp. MB02u-9 TaxID=2759823 RepID=UPI0015F5736C|nr:hypothetical protein [Colwellia sp. MB02u-9]MBA6295466.1 hypothetical protein [Colwellia sp. MB02u-9]